ncbi:hypothetical protein CYMTET_51356 [Cymbomonas tetramitiformis]|uniref:Uncharacterized protein n=1 Tax=Cymbomonas tetramitiformis TaxID=36881 RepID=A0AAE0BL84_9CHLO|nr:hypothetical protein CYMTET_51356 [Cymbomonas tetramitiformis]
MAASALVTASSAMTDVRSERSVLAFGAEKYMDANLRMQAENYSVDNHIKPMNGLIAPWFDLSQERAEYSLRKVAILFEENGVFSELTSNLHSAACHLIENEKAAGPIASRKELKPGYAIVHKVTSEPERQVARNNLVGDKILEKEQHLRDVGIEPPGELYPTDTAEIHFGEKHLQLVDAVDTTNFQFTESSSRLSPSTFSSVKTFLMENGIPLKSTTVKRRMRRKGNGGGDSGCRSTSNNGGSGVSHSASASTSGGAGREGRCRPERGDGQWGVKAGALGGPGDPEASWKWLRGLQLPEIFACPFSSVRHVPKRVRDDFVGAMRWVLRNLSGDHEDFWRMLGVAPRMVLAPQPGGRKKFILVEPFDEGRTAGKGDTVPCLILVFLPPCLEPQTLEALEALHPHRDGLPAPVRVAPLVLEEAVPVEAVCRQSAASEPGCSSSSLSISVSSLTPGMYGVPAIQHACEQIVSNKVPEEILLWLIGARLVALLKPGGGVRPIACGEVLRRLAGKAVCRQMRMRFAAHFGAPPEHGTTSTAAQVGFGVQGAADVCVCACTRYVRSV